jgi:hypothetical protein
MFKKFVSLVLLAAVISAFTLNVFAYPTDSDGSRSSRYLYDMIIGDDGNSELDINDVIYGNDAGNTKQFLFTITRPEGDEIVFSASYAVCGITNTDGITIALSRYNSKTGKYEALKDTDGLSRWNNISKLFSKEIKLKEGANKIKIVAYKKSEEGSLELGENLQVNVFTVTLLNSSKKDKIVKNGLSLDDIFNLRAR